MGQVCQKCGDGDLMCSKSKVNGPIKSHGRGRTSQRGGGASLPNSDMTFHAGGRDTSESAEYGQQNTIFTQMEDINLSNFDPALLSNIVASGNKLSETETKAMA